MFNLANTSIRKKSIFLGVFPALLTVLILTSYYLVQRIEDAEKQTDIIVKILLDQLSASIEYPVISGNYHLLKPLADSALEVDQIISVEVLNVNQESIYFSSRQPDLLSELKTSDDVEKYNVSYLEQTVFQQVNTITQFDDFSDEFTDDEVQVPQGKTTQQLIGYIRLGLDEDFITETAAKLFLQSVLIGLLMMLGFWFVATNLAASISRPLERLAHALKSMADQDYRTRIDVTEASEIGDLQRNTNILIESLDRAHESNVRHTQQLVEARFKADQANKAKSDFLSVVSHELRTPINGALGAVQIIASSGEDENVDGFIEVAEQSLLDLEGLVGDMLVLIDSDRKQLAIEAKDVDIYASLLPMVNNYQQQAERKSVRFKVFIDQVIRQHLIYIDEGKCLQVVRHLLDNAVKFTSEGEITASIYIETNKTRVNLRVDVADTGIGIPEQHIEKVLRPFEQLDSSYIRQFDGAGLGLTVVNKTVELLSGEFHIDSQKKRGVLVSVSLPIRLANKKVKKPTFKKQVAQSNVENSGSKTSQALAQENIQPPVIADLEQEAMNKALLVNKSVMLVSDNQQLEDITVKIISRIGCQLQAAHGAITLYDVLHGECDYLLLDYHPQNLFMQDLLQQIQAAKQKGSLLGLSVIAIVQDDNKEVRQHTLALGIADVMVRPIQQAQLEKKMLHLG